MCEGTSEALICLQASGFLQIIRLFKRPSVDLGCSSWNSSSRLRPPSQPGARWSLSSWTACSLRRPSRWHPSRSSWLRGRAPPCSRGGRGSSHRRSETGLGSGGSQADNQNYRMKKKTDLSCWCCLLVEHMILVLMPIINLWNLKDN